MSKCLPKKRNALSKAPNPNPPGTMSHVQTEKTHKQFKRMGQQQNIYYATVCIKKMLYISAIPQMSTPVIWDDLTVCYDILLSLSLLDLQYLS